MSKKYVLRRERNLVLEGELCNVLEKVLIDFGKLFQRIEAVWLSERLDILREDVEGRSRLR